MGKTDHKAIFYLPLVAVTLSILFLSISFLPTIDYLGSLNTELVEMGEMEESESETEKEKEGEEKEFNDLFHELNTSHTFSFFYHHSFSLEKIEQSAFREITTPPPEIS